MEIRKYCKSDTETIAQLFHDTIHFVNSVHYNPVQLAAWAPDQPDVRKWTEKLEQSITYVANYGAKIVGFGNFTEDGVLDCLYSHFEHQGQGVGSRLLDFIETEAKSRGIEKLTTEASITARPFFEKRGFVVVREQEIECRGETLLNFLMQKELKGRWLTRGVGR